MASGRRADRTPVRLEMPLLQIFRMAAEKGDARRPPQRQDAAGNPLLGTSRRGTDEQALRQALTIDLTNLLNTTNLASSIDLSAHPAVRRSILNYGVDDLVSLTLGSAALAELTVSLREALLAHEPRLVPGSLAVTRHDSGEGEATEQRISFHIAAELRCRPVDIPVEFVAEIDIGSGKLDIHEDRGGRGSRGGKTGPSARAG